MAPPRPNWALATDCSTRNSSMAPMIGNMRMPSPLWFSLLSMPSIRKLFSSRRVPFIATPVTPRWFRCELQSRHSDRVEVHANQPAQSVQRAPVPGRSDRFVRALVSAVSALLRARHRAGGRTWCQGGCQLHLALGAGLCTRAEQTLPTASQADEQE